MSYFNDSNLSIEGAINYFYDYVEKNGGHVNKNLRPRIVTLPNNSRVFGQSSVEEGIIALDQNPSIITFFHELKHFIRNYHLQSGTYNAWVFEDNYSETASLKPNRIAYINRGIKGLFLEEGIAELVATKAYWELCNNSAASERRTSQRTVYNQEVSFIYKLCTILDIDVDVFINSNPKHGRELLKQRFEYYSNGQYRWDDFEAKCDFVAMEKKLWFNHPEYTIDNSSLNKINQYSKGINRTLADVLSIAHNIGIISKYSCMKKLEQFNTYIQYEA